MAILMAALVSGCPANDEPTSAAARSSVSSSVTLRAPGLLPGSAWPSSLSIRKRLIASALLAAWSQAPLVFGRPRRRRACLRQFQVIPAKPTTRARDQARRQAGLHAACAGTSATSAPAGPTGRAAIGRPSRNRARSSASCHAVS